MAELRRFAQGEADRRAALRALAIAQALEGASRADAARVVGLAETRSVCGWERQSLPKADAEAQVLCKKPRRRA